MIDIEARARALNERAVADAPPIENVLARARHYRLRRRAVVSAITACVVVGGIVAAAWATNGNNGVGGVHTVNSTSPRPAPVDPKTAAEGYAADLLARAPIPPGATPYRGDTPPHLERPFETVATPNFVDRHEFWIVDQPTARVLSFMQRHAPSGTTMNCCGTEKHFDTLVVTMIEFDPHFSNPAFRSAGLQLSIAPRSATTSWIRADAQVVWYPLRDPAERVPSTDRVIVITRSPADSAQPSRRIVVTDRDKVDHLEQVFNAARPSALLGPHSCPQTPRYTLAFEASVHAAVDVVAHVGCGDAAVTIGGQRFPDLEGFESEIEPLFNP